MTDKSREIANKSLTQVAVITKRRAFMPDYQAGISDADALGIAIANWADWDGEKIVEAFFSALEDANFHGERAAMMKIWTSPASVGG